MKIELNKKYSTRFRRINSRWLVKRFDLKVLMRSGLIIIMIGICLMLFGMMYHIPIIYSLFMPMMVIFFGLCFIVANASTLAMSQVSDKSHGSAVMNFLNMGLATIVVLRLSYLPLKILLLPIVFIGFTMIMAIFYKIRGVRIS